MTVAVQTKTICLTAPEAELWDWAADAAIEFWQAENCDIRDDSKSFEQAVYPAVDGIGRLVNDPDVGDDMIYRLTTQITDMAIEEGGFDQHGRANKTRMKALRDVRTGRQVAAKIYRAFGID